MSASSKGSARERQVRKLLESEGWAVTRGAGSHGCADLWAAQDEKEVDEDGYETWLGTTLRLIQVKTDKRGPFANFGPKARQELSALAAQTGGVAELWHWPARGKCRILLEDSWPRDVQDLISACCGESIKRQGRKLVCAGCGDPA